MTNIEYLIYGAAGGLAVELSELLRAMARVNGVPWKRPREPGLTVLILSILIRVALGAGVSFILGVSEQISGPIGAFSAGITAPLVVDQIGSERSERTPAPTQSKTPGRKPVGNSTRRRKQVEAEPESSLSEGAMSKEDPGAAS